MASQRAVGFDIPQNRPRVPPPFHQTPEWYKIQQETGVRRSAGRVRPDSHEQPLLNQNFALQLCPLQRHYTILDDDRRIIELLGEEPALHALLLEAVKPLQDAFGEKRIVQVRVQSSDEDSLLKVAVQLPADFGADPERALRSFDEAWWLNNCHRSGGALVFDYEMRDAI